MFNVIKPLCLAALTLTAAACGGVGSEAVAPASAPEARGAREARAGDLTTRPRVPAVYEGTWHLAADGARFTLTVGPGGASLRAEGDAVDRAVEGLAWDAAAARLTFRALAADGYRWFDGVIAGPVVRGRFARGDADRAPRADAYVGQFTGWNADLVDAELYPRVFDLRLADGRRARLRLDRPAADAALAATFKVYGSDARGAADEEPERPARVDEWDGAALTFAVEYPAGPLTFAGSVDGRRAAGTASLPGSFTTVAWTATRAEVLSHGLTARTRDERRAWADRTRRALERLMMDGAPAPAFARVTPLSTGLSPIRPLTAEPAGALPQAYTVGQVRLEFTLRDARGGADATRAVHAWVARPSTPPPPRGYPVVVALNGHGGSALAVMDPNSAIYGYGDAYARRGFVVVAVDVSHRPVTDRAALYGDVPDGDGPFAGNGAHPAVRHGALPPAWEEDGERAWDVSRALDYALSLPDIDRARVAVTGLSMGGEVATFAGAFDARFSTVIAAGFSPDLNVTELHGNHGCWRWAGGDATEYVDTSDLHALVAPRSLVVETGVLDRTFSGLVPPFAADKQVMRRSRVAWADAASRVIHFLHGGVHVYRVGDPFFDDTPTAGITVPSVTGPEGTNLLAWQFDPTTTLRAMSVFDLAAGFNR